MLQQPSEFIMYQKLPLDLNVHSAEVNNLHPDFKDLTLQLQAQRAAATQAFFFDAYAMRATVPSSATPPMFAAGIQGMCDLPIHAMYNHPIQAMYDPLRHHPQQQHLQLPQPQQQQHHHHHHQQQQHQQHQYPAFVPTAGTASAGSWQQQQESRGSWFPNWQEVFHGFVVEKDSQQEKQATGPSLEEKPPLHQGVIVAPPVAAMEATINAGEAQQPYVQTDTAQRLDPCPLSPPGSHHAAPLLPHCTPRAEKECDGNTITTPPISTIGAPVSDAEPQQPRVDSDGAQLIDPNPPLPPSSNSTTALLPYTAPAPEKRRENSLVHCTDLKNRQSLPPIDGIACKYTTQSPSWLPQGWITEVQTRRTGTTAGTRDKYYKDLVSGRRFRSRNEVIHFLQTGKGRLRKRRRKKAFASSAFGGHHDLLSHQHSLAQDSTSSSCLFLAPQPIGFLLGPLVNSHPVQTGPNPTSAQGSVEEEIEAPCQSPVVQPTSSSMQSYVLGLKQPIEVRPQKLPVQRKAKTLSPKTCEDKQASRLWQWLQKPARTTEQPQRQDADKHVNDDGKTLEDSGREPQIAQRTAQLGKEVEVAQKTIMRLGKEMQATVEKLTQEIQTAQRDMRLETQATDVSNVAMDNVVEAAHRLDSAMGNVTQATQNLVMAMGIAVQAAQLSAQNSGATSPPKQPQATVPSVVPEVSRPDVAMMHSTPSAYTTQVVERPDRVMGYSMDAAKQPQVAVATGVPEVPGPQVAMAHPATRGSTTQVAERPDLAMRYLMQAHQIPNGMMGCSTEAVQRPDLARGCIAQLVQMPDVTMHYKIPEAHMSGDAMCNPARAFQSPLVVMSSPWTQTTQRADMATGIVNITDVSPLNMGELNKDMHAYQKAVEMSNQIVDARTGHIIDRNFAALNLKLDLSMISPSLSSRQRAKFVQKMKAKHTRGLLVVLGRKLCLEALCKAVVRGRSFEPKEEPVVLNSL